MKIAKRLPRGGLLAFGGWWVEADKVILGKLYLRLGERCQLFPDSMEL